MGQGDPQCGHITTVRHLAGQHQGERLKPLQWRIADGQIVLLVPDDAPGRAGR